MTNCPKCGWPTGSLARDVREVPALRASGRSGGTESRRASRAECGDMAQPEDDSIRAAHPLRTGRHDLYAEAMRLVGAKHSKRALVDLVNWLLGERR